MLAVEFFCKNYSNPAKVLPVEAYAEEFIARKSEENLREHSFAEIKKYIGQFIAMFPNLNVRDFKTEHAKGFLSHYNNKNRNRKAVVEQFFNYLSGRALTTNRETPVIQINPFKALSKPRRNISRLRQKRILNIEESIQVLRFATKFNAQKMFVWLLFTGMRPLESVRFWTKTSTGTEAYGWDAIDLETGQIHVHEVISKTRVDRNIRISENLRKWLTIYKGQAFITRNWRDKYGWVKATMPKGKSQVSDICRHTFISYLAKVSPWQEVELQTGNSRGIQIKHYLDIVTDDASAFWKIEPETIGQFDIPEEEMKKRAYENRKRAILINKTKIRHKKNGKPIFDGPEIELDTHIHPSEASACLPPS